MLEGPVAKKAKLRHYNDDFIMFRFISVDPHRCTSNVVSCWQTIPWTKSSCSIIKNPSIHYLLVKIGKILREKRNTAVHTIRLVKKMNTARQANQVLWCLKFLPSAFRPVRRYALVRMRKPCSADDKHGADEKTLLCCCKRIFKNPLFNSFIAFF